MAIVLGELALVAQQVPSAFRLGQEAQERRLADSAATVDPDQHGVAAAEPVTQGIELDFPIRESLSSKTT
jgi:hypothetical protein